MPPAGFEPAVPASDRLQTLVLDRSATGIGPYKIPLLHSYSVIYLKILYIIF